MNIKNLNMFSMLFHTNEDKFKKLEREQQRLQRQKDLEREEKRLAYL